jgi:hypothetical protein
MRLVQSKWKKMIIVYGDDQEMIKCSMEKKKEKQNPIEIKANVLLRVLVLVIKTP